MKLSNFLTKGLYLFLGLVCLSLYNNCAAKSSDTAASTETPQGSPTPPALKCFEQLGTNNEWSHEEEVVISGFTGNANEPQIAADGVVLLFNNKTSDDTQMDVHYAVKQADGSYLYRGALGGANLSGVLDGVPATDTSNNYYFMSLRNFGAGNPARYRTLFGSQFALVGGNLSVINVAPADASFPNGEPPTASTFHLDMDLGLSWDGTKAIVARTTFSGSKAYPDVSQLEMFNVNPATRSLTSDPNSSFALKNVNLEACRIYAPTMSFDKLELYYSVLEFDASNNPTFRIVSAKRANVDEAFGRGTIISAITGQFFEGPSISYHDGGKTLYYHKLDSASGRFKIYKVTRP